MQHRPLLAFISALSLGATSLWAQTVAPDKESDDPTKKANSVESESEEMIILDPFTVSTEHEDYKAVDTLAGGRIRTSLKDTPASLTVVTKKLMNDLGITNATELLIYTPSTEVAGLLGNYSGLGNRGGGVNFGNAVENSRLVNPAGVNRSRGLTPMDNTRNYFPTDIPWDGYNISRIDISRGPNSFLYGTGSPSGISNVATNEATFKPDSGSAEFRYGSFGSTRQSLDYNKVLLPNQLAIRIDAVNSDTKYKQKPAFNESERIYGALRFDPEFLKTDSARTKIQASFEHGEGNSNNPRILPPVDYITGYLNDPMRHHDGGGANPDTGVDTGVDPWDFTQNLTERGADPRYSLWANAGSVSNMYQWGGGPQFFWDAETGTLLRQGQTNYKMGPGSTPNTWNVHTAGFAGYATAVNRIYLLNGFSPIDAPFPGAYASTISYLDETLRDPSVFDFYNKLIDGDNKREWQNWDAYNLSVTQSLFNDRLTVQAIVDHQEFTNGYKGAMTGRTPTIMMDLNKYLLTGNPTWIGSPTPNPNVGRPLVFSDQGRHESNETTRDNYQVTAAYLFDFQKDLKVEGLLGRILGHHNITGLWSQFERSSETRVFLLNGVEANYLKGTKDNVNARTRDVNFNWLAYMGPSLLGRTNAQGANLKSVQHTLAYPDMANFRVWSDEWVNDSVDPTDEWIYTGKDGVETTGTQAENPANYRGYILSPYQLIDGASNPGILAESGQKGEQIIESKAVMYQGHFWDDTIVPSFGYREDTTKQNGASYNPNADVISLDYDITGPGVKATTKSTSYGVAVHLPKVIKKHLPEGTDLTFHYFHGENQTPKVRYGMDGLQLPNESGETDDFSVQFDGLDDRLTVRLTYFKTTNQNSSAYVGVPLATWLVRGLPAITLQYFGWGAAERALGIDPVTKEVFNAPASWDNWRKEGNQWRWRPHGWMDTQPEDWIAHEEAMKTVFTEAFPQSYWDTWGYNIDVNAIKTGDWLHIIKGWDDPWAIWKFGGQDKINGEYPTLEQNLESKGYELEVSYRPLKNWDIIFNASQVDATQVGFGQAATNFITKLKEVFVDSPVGYGNVWGGFETAKTMFNGDVWSKYLIQTALVGSEQPEQRKYRFNAISNYRFDRGPVKGLNIGAAFRWEDKAILGYRPRYDETPNVGWIPDVDAPLYGPTEEHLDMWVGYGRKFNEKIKWTLQLNVRNVAEEDRLVTIAVQPDGSTAQSRIASGTTYDLTLKFDF